jgi:hypothetical protein
VKKQSVFVLFGLLAVAVILGCSQSSENTFENPVAGINASTSSTPTPGRVESTAKLGKVRICHFPQPDDAPGPVCGTDPVVIEVSQNAFPKFHQLHGDFVTLLPIGTCNCDD